MPVPGDAPRRHIHQDQRQQNRNQPIPHRHGRGSDDHILAGEKVGILRVPWREHSSAGVARDLIEDRFVALEIAQLRIGVHRDAAEQHAALLLPQVAEGDDIIARTPGVEIAFVRSRSGLHEVNWNELPIGADDIAGNLQEVEEIVVLVHRLDDDFPLSSIERRLHVKVAAHWRARHGADDLSTRIC